MNINTTNVSTMHPQRVTTHHSIQHTAAGTTDAAKHHVRHYNDDALASMFTIAVIFCGIALLFVLTCGALAKYIFHSQRKDTNR